jgi:hypothetical protein
VQTTSIHLPRSAEAGRRFLFCSYGALSEPECFPANCLWEAAGKDESLLIRLRQVAAWPIYTLSMILDYTSAALGRLAALVAGDDWPG